MKPVTTTNPESAIRVLKTGTCPALSGKAKLTYQIGCMGKADIQFRISANSNPGFFNADWVSLSEIQEELDKSPSGKPITSFVLNEIFRGKSMNTPGFLFAALKQEGLVERSKDKQRCYDRGDPREFMSAVKALIALDGKPEGKPQEQPKVEAKQSEVKPKTTDKPKQATARKSTASPKKVPAKPKAKKRGR